MESISAGIGPATGRPAASYRSVQLPRGIRANCSDSRFRRMRAAPAGLRLQGVVNSGTGVPNGAPGRGGPDP